jgi:hypothetical protein
MDNVSSIIDGSIAAAGMVASLAVSVWALLDSHADGISIKKVETVPGTLPKAA